MWIYLLVLAIPLGMSFQAPRRRNRQMVLVAYYLLLWLFVGLRHEVGPDWFGYTNIHEATISQDWLAIVGDREPGFFLINKLSQVLGWGLHGVNAIGAALFLFGIHRYATRTANAWLATAAVVPFLVFIISMSGVRQAAALGVIFALLADWDKAGVVRKLVVIGLAATIHNSALFMLVFVLWGGSRYPWLRIVLGSLALLVGIYLLVRSGATDVYAQRYLVTNVESGGAIYHVALSSFPAVLYLVFRRQITAHGWANPLVFLASLVAIALLPLVFVSSTGTSRLALYLSFVQMWVFPAFVAAHGKRWVGATWICVLYFLTVFLVYFMLGTHASAYIPYENVLWNW